MGLLFCIGRYAFPKTNPTEVRPKFHAPASSLKRPSGWTVSCVTNGQELRQYPDRRIPLQRQTDTYGPACFDPRQKRSAFYAKPFLDRW